MRPSSAQPARHPGRIVLTIASLLALGLARPAVAAEEASPLAGTWMWTWKDGEGKMHKHVLDVESAAGKLTGRERFDDLESIKVDDLKLKGEEVSFTVKRGTRRSEYRGKLVGTKTINGLVNVSIEGQPNEFQWTAERAIETKKP